VAEIKTISVTYGRKFNLGDYNSAHLETTYWADLDVNEDPEGVALNLWDTAKADVKAQALPLIKSKTKAQPAPTSTPAPNGADSAKAPPGNAPSSPAPAQIVEVAVKSFGIAATQGGAPYVKIKGGRYVKHGIPLYDDQMPPMFLNAFPTWATWPIDGEYTDVPDFMAVVLYDKNAKKIVGFK